MGQREALVPRVQMVRQHQTVLLVELVLQEVRRVTVLREVPEERPPLRLLQLLRVVQLQQVAPVALARLHMPEDLSDRIILQDLLLDLLQMCMQQAQLLRLVLLVKTEQRVVPVEVLHLLPQAPEVWAEQLELEVRVVRRMRVDWWD